MDVPYNCTIVLYNSTLLTPFLAKNGFKVHCALTESPNFYNY
jgi:hypothetical protein